MALDAGETAKAVGLNVDGVQGAPGSFAAMPASQRQMMLDNAKTIAELRTKFPPFKAQIRKITCKTLVINGEESALWLRRIGKLAATSLPHAWFAIISKSRHFPHIENAPEFNERVLNFLSTSS
jgi:pimeloyl-ACP methyl ester carboxylesterase